MTSVQLPIDSPTWESEEFYLENSNSINRIEPSPCRMMIPEERARKVEPNGDLRAGCRHNESEQATRTPLSGFPFDEGGKRVEA